MFIISCSSGFCRVEKKYWTTSALLNWWIAEQVKILQDRKRIFLLMRFEYY